MEVRGNQGREVEFDRISCDTRVCCIHFWVGEFAQVMNGYRSGSALGLDPKLGKDVSPQHGMASPRHRRDASVGVGWWGGGLESVEIAYCWWLCMFTAACGIDGGLHLEYVKDGS